MSTMNISLSDSRKAFVDARVSECGLGTSSEYAHELTRTDQDRCYLLDLLLAGAESPACEPTDAAYFSRLRKRATGRRPATSR